MTRIPALTLFSYMNSKPSAFSSVTSDGGKNTSLWDLYADCIQQIMQILITDACMYMLCSVTTIVSDSLQPHGP